MTSYASSSPHSLAVKEAVAEAMRPAVPNRVTAKPPARPSVAAGADEPERHPPDSIDGEQLVPLPDANAADDNGVHLCPTYDYREGCECRHCTGRCLCTGVFASKPHSWGKITLKETLNSDVAHERERLARLARWHRP